MASVWTNVVLGLALSSLFVPASAQQQDLPEPPVLPTLSPPLPPRWILFPEPSPLLPLTHHCPILESCWGRPTNRSR